MGRLGALLQTNWPLPGTPCFDGAATCRSCSSLSSCSACSTIARPRRLVGARMLRRRVVRAVPAGVCRRHRAAWRVDARHAASHRRFAVDARRVLDRAPSALRRQHARGAGMRAAVGNVVSAADRRVVELHLPRAHRRTRRSLSSERRSATAFAHGRTRCRR